MEMFSGKAGQFLAILESLADSSYRTLQKAHSSLITELDQETVSDVYQVCIDYTLAHV